MNKTEVKTHFYNIRHNGLKSTFFVLAISATRCIAKTLYQSLKKKLPASSKSAKPAA
jgi:hypothetical protein